MKDVEIIDSFVDDREFRNYVINLLENNGFKLIKIDDERVSDKSRLNDNDFIVEKNNTSYTVNTFLNKEIGEKQLKEVINDIKKEKVTRGIIVTNKRVDPKIKQNAKNESIIIYDREKFKK